MLRRRRLPIPASAAPPGASLACPGLGALLLFGGLGALLLFPAPASAQTPKEFFESRVRPVLAESCMDCHGRQAC